MGAAGTMEVPTDPGDAESRGFPEQMVEFMMIFHGDLMLKNGMILNNPQMMISMWP